MGVFRQDGPAVEWRGDRETVRMEPWTADRRDAWTGAPVAGGQWLTAAAPLEIIPVFVRDGGSVQPFGDLDRCDGGEG